MDNQSVGKSVAALVLGIIGLMCTLGRGMFIDLAGLILCIVGLVLAINARKELAPGEGGRGMATAGMICAIIGLVMAGLGLLCTACAFATMPFFGHGFRHFRPFW